MKGLSLYSKILFSFLALLLLVQVLMFGSFLLFDGRQRSNRLDSHLRGLVLFSQKFAQEAIRARLDAQEPLAETLRAMTQELAQIMRAKVWFQAAHTPVVQSFDGPIPEQIMAQAQSGARGRERFTVFPQPHRQILIVAPLKTPPLQDAKLFLLLVHPPELHPPQHLFLARLVLICLLVAMLVIPVSRFIAKPIKQLRKSALLIAEGELSHRADIKSRDEMGELGRAFNHMADRVERMVRGGRELTANVSHELRTPLARIRLAEELLREKLARGEFEPCQRHLKGIQDDVKELDRLLGRILELSKLDVHEEPFKLEPLDLSPMTAELLSRLEPALRRRRVGLMTHLSLNCFVSGDRAALQTALSNVLENAAKFTPEKGQVIVRLESAGQNIRFSLTNTFEALDEEELSRIFEPFHRPERSPAAGSGLGLAIAKKIVEKHGGAISAANAAAGFEIQIRLPAGPA